MFGFPSADRAENFQFSTNFLKSVIIQVRYDSVEVSPYKEKLVELLRSELPNHKDLAKLGMQIKRVNNKTQFIPQRQTSTGLQFTSKDGRVTLTIGNEEMTLNYDGSIYQNFEWFVKDLGKKFIEVLGVLKIDHVNRVAIRKINLLQFEEIDGITAIEGAGMIFNHVLFDQYLQLPGSKQLSRALLNFGMNEGPFSVNLALGLLPSDSTLKHAVLDIDLYNTTGQTITQIVNTLKQINDEIFNIFIWSLREETINQLKENSNV